MLARRLPGILPAHDLPGGAGGDEDVLGAGAAAGGPGAGGGAAVPLAAPHHLRRGAGGRRPAHPAGRAVAGAPGACSSSTSCPSSARTCWRCCASRWRRASSTWRAPTRHLTYPCQVMLVAAMNPCPCGYFNVPGRRCTCAERRVHDYHARVSGPLLDRIDITLQTRPVEHRLFTSAGGDEPPVGPLPRPGGGRPRPPAPPLSPTSRASTATRR